MVVIAAKDCHFYIEEALSICKRWDSENIYAAYSVNECSKGQFFLIRNLSELYTGALILYLHTYTAMVEVDCQ